MNHDGSSDTSEFFNSLLAYLVKIVETGSFKEAAATFNVSQSALSKAVSLMESGCGLRLLERGRRGTMVAATPAGERVVCRARTMLAERNSLLRELGELRKETVVGD